MSLVLEAKDDKIFIFIEDSGSGIPPGNLKEIFEPFFSLKNDSQDGSDNKHCGIGLSLAKKIIEDEFSGQILVESVLGQGSRFIIILPDKTSE